MEDVGMNRFSLILALAASSVSLHNAFAQKVGDRVVVVRDTKIKTWDSVAGTAPVGLACEVYDVRGSQLFISDLASGWISRADVVDPDKAIAWFSERLRKQPKDGEAYLARGNARAAKDQFDAAIEDYNEA